MRVAEDAPEITTMALPLPPLPKAPQRAEQLRNWELVRVESGQTLGAIFQQRGIPAATLHRLLDATPDREALTRLRPGAELAFEQAPDGRLLAFRYDRSDTQRVELSLEGDQVAEKVIERPVDAHRGDHARSALTVPFRAQARPAGGDQHAHRRGVQVRHRLDRDVTASDRFGGGRADLTRG